MKNSIQHYINPLHIYCRFRDMGLPEKLARFLCIAYEDSIYKLFKKGHTKCRYRHNSCSN